MVNKHQLLEAIEHVEALNLVGMLLVYLLNLNHFLMVKIHLHDVLPKQQMFYFIFKFNNFHSYFFKFFFYFENGKTSKTNFSNLIPFIWDGLSTYIPFSSSDGIFFLAI
jgi:hypothetical protein